MEESDQKLLRPLIRLQGIVQASSAEKWTIVRRNVQELKGFLYLMKQRRAENDESSVQRQKRRKEEEENENARDGGADTDTHRHSMKEKIHSSSDSATQIQSGQDKISEKEKVNNKNKLHLEQKSKAMEALKLPWESSLVAQASKLLKLKWLAAPIEKTILEFQDENIGSEQDSESMSEENWAEMGAESDSLRYTQMTTAKLSSSSLLALLSQNVADFRGDEEDMDNLEENDERSFLIPSTAIDDVGRAQSWIQQGKLWTVAKGEDERIQIIADALHVWSEKKTVTTDSILSLLDAVRCVGPIDLFIDDIQEESSKTSLTAIDDRVRHLALIACARALIGLRSMLVTQHLEFIVPLERHILYWEHKTQNPWWYIWQIFPRTIFGFLQNRKYWSLQKIPQVFFYTPYKNLHIHHDGVTLMRQNHVASVGQLAHYRQPEHSLLLSQGHLESLALFCFDYIQFFNSMLKNRGNSKLKNRNVSTPANCLEMINRIEALAIDFEQEFMEDAKLVRIHAKPNFLERYWVGGLGSVLIAWFGTKQVNAHWGDIINWIQESKVTIARFATEWLWKPFKRIYETVRYEDNQMALISGKSLQNDLDSLERMVKDFAFDHLNAQDAELELHASRARDGDLSIVMHEYEKGIREPYKSLVFGNLVTTVLIQVQKSKVDLELAMTSMDKILKSNELNFQIIAAVPTFLILRYFYGRTNNMLKEQRGISATQAKDQIRRHFRRLEISVNQLTANSSQAIKSYDILGEIVVSLYLLGLYARELRNANLIQDLREIEGFGAEHAQQQLNTIHRMYNTHNFFKNGDS